MEHCFNNKFSTVTGGMFPLMTEEALGFQIDGAKIFFHNVKVEQRTRIHASWCNIPKIDGAIAPLAPP